MRIAAFLKAPLKTKNFYRAVTVSPQAIEVLNAQKDTRIHKPWSCMARIPVDLPPTFRSEP